MQKRVRSRKTRFVAFVATSVDGRISLTKHTLPDWISKEDQRLFQNSLSHVDAVIVGRNTYRAAATRLRTRTTFVLSNRLKTVQRRGTVTFVNPAHVDLAELFRQYKTVAVLGGGAVYRTMLERNLLDEIYVTVEPLIFGRGNAMCIGCTRTTRLRLLSVRRLNRTGTLLLHYTIN
ncbi:MAG: dihydrofolate reductase [bacterium]|nr:dihydrofolate reductase [bacterium]